MGTNAVRLIRSDHRRISDLLARLNGHHLGGADLPQRFARELSAHVAASRDCVVPFAESRVNNVVTVAASLDELMAVADTLRKEGAGGQTLSTADLVEIVRRHVDAEERHVLQPLEGVASVDRLRVLGESFRRTRDAALRSEAGPRRHHVRPPASRAELYEHARYRNIAGRAAMSRTELLAALKRQR